VADEDVVRALYDEHAAQLMGYVLRLVGGDRQRAEDVVQETLLRAWRHPDSLAPNKGSARPWLWTVARHLVVDGERARRARPAEVAQTALGAVPVEDGVDRALVAQLVAEAIETLSPEHRAAVVETYFRGRSVAEAAGVLGVPAGTVKSRTYYALRALRLALEERGITGSEEAT
jgi:RNA polymerase sigma-70 factor, ECF subfamily